MIEWNAAAGLAVHEAIRPRSSGEVVDTHVFAQPRQRTWDYERMRRAVSGETDEKTEDTKVLQNK